MKKNLFLIFASILSVSLLTSYDESSTIHRKYSFHQVSPDYSENASTNVSLEGDELFDYADLSDATIEIVIENNTSDNIEYGQLFEVEFYENGWKHLNVEVPHNDILNVLEPGKK
ncbi:immunoglobulin-like domain-containing protein [Marinilactibacillus sp. Marseille-P9653]|uniref:immunoglobulin-like domain-containing protein n=1 Tax=Marinilactibacillus sp. Marseille-P9653 TaxID=2866583 RepID=UPI001CE4AEBC|nr:immunoglobulin-like domain-containing protein [Marinilactibacillus sp. Marseille-P9653]